MQRLKSGLNAAVSKTQEIAEKAKDADGRKSLTEDAKKLASDTKGSAQASVSSGVTQAKDLKQRLSTEEGRKNVQESAKQQARGTYERTQRQAQWTAMVAQKSAEEALSNLQAAVVDGDAPPDRVPAGMWACARCTLHNGDLAVRCEACGGARPDEPAAVAPPELVLKCGRCGTVMRYPSWASRVQCPTCSSVTVLSTMDGEQEAALQRAQQAQLTAPSTDIFSQANRELDKVNRELEKAWDDFWGLSSSSSTASAPLAGAGSFAEITVPPGMSGGQQLQVQVNGQMYATTLPPGASSGQRIRVRLS